MLMLCCSFTGILVQPRLLLCMFFCNKQPYISSKNVFFSFDALGHETFEFGALSDRRSFYGVVRFSGLESASRVA